MGTIQFRHRGRLAGIGPLAVGAIGTVLLLAPAPVQASDCVSAEIESPMRFPDGRVHPSGRLTLCDWKEFSPVVDVHRTYVNGQPVSMLLGRKSSNEGGGGIPSEILFTFDDEGRLELVGYVRSARGRSETFLFEPRRRRERIEANRPPWHGTEQLVVAARPH